MVVLFHLHPACAFFDDDLHLLRSEPDSLGLRREPKDWMRFEAGHRSSNQSNKHKIPNTIKHAIKSPIKQTIISMPTVSDMVTISRDSAGSARPARKIRRRACAL